ncbi:MAG: anhydro-N-acetylmuramic acid kinase [Flavobacteriales bacterium]|nr:anhydro-N-acetylmuramic acid kinase [Flavobacteriales bacterium]
MKPYKVLGLMSGTSLDGLDMAYAEFFMEDGKWKMQHIVAETLPYTDDFKKWLIHTMHCNATELIERHIKYGKFLGNAVLKFIQKHQLLPDLVASHGHTIFHQPEQGFSFQLGHGSGIKAITGMDTVWDFRTMDVLLGGQGAPLVPIGDRLLFGNYDACLNLGGISNISFEYQDERIAFDISPFNIVFNQLCQPLGISFDSGGQHASTGKLNKKLLEALNQLEFYNKKPPRSLSKEWIDKHVFPLFKKYPDTTENHLHTFAKHAALQISDILNKYHIKNVLTTGGGTYNKFFIEELKKLSLAQIIIPDDTTIQFKEALIFGLLGVLRIRNEINTLASVTGAGSDSSGGCIS